MTATDRLPGGRRQGRLARARRALRAAAPGWRIALLGGVLWAAAMAASAAFSVWHDGWQTGDKIFELAIVFAIGALIAFPIGLLLARLVTPNGRAEARFAAAFIGLALATIGITAGLYALQYRFYYARWHADVFTTTWTLQFVVTTIVAFVQFAVSGVRMYFPFGFVALFIAAFWFARLPR
jgi:hypothetical protein